MPQKMIDLKSLGLEKKVAVEMLNPLEKKNAFAE